MMAFVLVHGVRNRMNVLGLAVITGFVCEIVNVLSSLMTIQTSALS